MAIQIFILSKLMEENTYPYKLKKQISALQPLESVNGLTESKLYYHFESLAKQGFIEAKEVIKEEHRPDKQVFAITDKGREILPKKIYKLFENAETIDDMVIGLANIKYIERDKVLLLIEKKLKSLKQKKEYLSRLNEQFTIEPDQQVFADFMKDYSNYRIDGSIQFLERLIEHIGKAEI
jgi:DNA-binding PadR family transcriptional regulator